MDLNNVTLDTRPVLVASSLVTGVNMLLRAKACAVDGHQLRMPLQSSIAEGEVAGIGGANAAIAGESTLVGCAHRDRKKTPVQESAGEIAATRSPRCSYRRYRRR